MSPHFRPISLGAREQGHIVFVKGNLDEERCRALLRELREKAERGESYFLLNFQDVSQVSSSSFSMLMQFAEELRQRYGGALCLTKVGPGILGLLQVLDLQSLLPVENLESEALDYLRQKVGNSPSQKDR